MTQPRLGRVKKDTTVYEVVKGVRDGLQVSTLKENQLVLLLSMGNSTDSQVCFTLLDAEGVTHSYYDHMITGQEIMELFDWEQLCAN